MMRLKTASLAVLGTAAIVGFVFAGPALAQGTTTKGAMAKDSMAKGAKYSQAQTKGSQTLARGERHGQRHAAYRGPRIHHAYAALPRDRMYRDRMYRRPVGPAEVAGGVVGGAVATAGAIATAPFRAFDNSYAYDNGYYGYNNYDNYYGYGYGGRDWHTYATRNGLACAPGSTFKAADGSERLCQ